MFIYRRSFLANFDTERARDKHGFRPSEEKAPISHSRQEFELVTTID